jgi:sugar phosphate permease
MIALSNISSSYWGSVFIPMIIIGIGQGLILAPVTSAGVHETPTKLSGIASGVTNTMHQIGGPIGLSIIVSMTDNFHMEIWMMVIFTIISIFIVAFFVTDK